MAARTAEQHAQAGDENEATADLADLFDLDASQQDINALGTWLRGGDDEGEDEGDTTGDGCGESPPQGPTSGC